MKPNRLFFLSQPDTRQWILPLSAFRRLHGELYSLTPECQSSGRIDQSRARGGMGSRDVEHILFEVDLGVDMRVPDEVDDPFFALFVG